MPNRKKLELVIEETQADDVIAWLGARGVKGYTVLPTIAGSGRHGARGLDPISGTGGNVYLFAVMNEDAAARLMQSFVADFPYLAGIAILSDVTVIRAERF